MSRAAARATLLHMLPGYLAGAGVEPETILRQAGLSVDDVERGTVVRRSQIHHALELSARCVGSAELGLALGATAQPDLLGAIGSAMTAGATAEACLQTQIALMPAMQSHAVITLKKQGDEAIWTHRLHGDDERAWLLYEGAASFNVHMLRHLLGPDWAPVRVIFPHRCRSLVNRYEDHFQAPVYFGDCDEARIHIKRHELSLPLRHYAARAVQPLRAHAGEIAELRQEDGSIELAISRMIEASLPLRPITLAMSARVLGLSARTVQRRLEDRGTAFEMLLDEQRHRLATAWLGSREEANVTDLAMALGYSDTAHFNRAFRRWEGQSPSSFRRRRLGQTAND
ncbi:AraC family transcriptional regulator ligand-binding domain-containing protein [Bosea sp. (in: a-proteobacteria)]|uniref:AraC family transcriptional regulator ligand-binding domain-containing protein n=1 Tax=Bosea sp. (in: a-proteobacteria) TaxID=1871050 RepID=UPI003B3A45C8